MCGFGFVAEAYGYMFSSLSSQLFMKKVQSNLPFTQGSGHHEAIRVLRT